MSTMKSERDSFVRRVRDAVGDTQVDFAARLGVDDRSVQRYERRDTMPQNKVSLQRLLALAKKHGITIS